MNFRAPATTVRRARPEDASQVAALFFNTVHRVNSADYLPAQVAAWAPVVPDPAEWAVNRFASRSTFVALAGDSTTVIGFGELEPDGHIDCLYCHHEYQRQGVGSAIHAAIEQEAVRLGLDRLFVESSITARPFFLAKGFAVMAEERVVRRGVELVRFQMEKRLPGRSLGG